MVITHDCMMVFEIESNNIWVLRPPVTTFQFWSWFWSSQMVLILILNTIHCIRFVVTIHLFIYYAKAAQHKIQKSVTTHIL